MPYAGWLPIARPTPAAAAPAGIASPPRSPRWRSCVVSDRGQPVRDLGKQFFFRAPPVAAERLAEMGVSCVTLANNHALDFGPGALRDTLDHLRAAGIVAVGAGADDAAARVPVLLRGGGMR